LHLHIGDKWVISLKDIITILSFEKSSKYNKEFYEKIKQNKKLVEVSSAKEAKTCIITPDKVYLTSISPHTLKKRIENF